MSKPKAIDLYALGDAWVDGVNNVVQDLDARLRVLEGTTPAPTPPGPTPSPTPEPGDLPVGTLAHDGPALPEQICLRLPITGTLATDATATVRYKRSSDTAWTTGHPLYRICPQYSEIPTIDGPLADEFAWPIIDCKPGTAYDVEVTVSSGGKSSKRTLAWTTRALPPAAGTPNKTANSASAIASAFAGLNPGDVLQIAEGAYDVSGLALTRSGTPQQPIYI